MCRDSTPGMLACNAFDPGPGVVSGLLDQLRAGADRPPRSPHADDPSPRPPSPESSSESCRSGREVYEVDFLDDPCRYWGNRYQRLQCWFSDSSLPCEEEKLTGFRLGHRGGRGNNSPTLHIHRHTRVVQRDASGCIVGSERSGTCPRLPASEVVLLRWTVRGRS